MKTLAACIVAKNEATLIQSCLDYIYPMVDQVVIVDTGSTDDTVNKIHQWVNKNNANVKAITVGNKFHDSDGDFHFGKAKTFAMQSADTDFVMWMDVADIMTDGELARKYFLKYCMENDSNICFTLPTSISKEFNFNRLRIVPKEYGYFIGRIHEFISKPDTLHRYHIPVQFNNQHNGDKLDRNIRLLLKDWEESRSARTAFYLGNSYREMADTENAIKWFRQRIFNFEWVNEFAEEHYKAAECIAELLLPLVKQNKVDVYDLIDISDELISLDNTRIEGYYYKGEAYLHLQKYTKALECFNNYKKCKIPKKEDIKLWLDPKIYVDKIVGKKIKYTEFAIKNSEPLVPDKIIDLNGSQSVYKHGDSQYQ
jgi:glycosyltransferase involved in cell wall biosynthesis